MKYKTQKEVIEKMKENQYNVISCNTENEKKAILDFFGLDYHKNFRQVYFHFKFIASIMKIDETETLLCTAEEFLALPKDEEEGWTEEIPKTLYEEHNKTPCELVPRVIVDSAVKASKEWKAFEDARFELMGKAVDMKSQELKRFVKKLNALISEINNLTKKKK